MGHYARECAYEVGHRNPTTRKGEVMVFATSSGKRIGLVLAMFFVVLACVAQAAPNTLGPRKIVGNGKDPDVAVDSQGYLHFAYVRNSVVYYTKYDYNTGNVLIPETVVGSGSDPQIAVDSQNNPHIVWNGMNYARWTGSGFSYILGVITAKSKPRIAIRDDDMVVVMCQAPVGEGSRAQLRFLKNGAILSGIKVVGGDCPGSLAVDSKGAVHLTWRGNHICHYNSLQNPPSTVTTGSIQIHPNCSDFQWMACDRRDDSLHVVNTSKGGAGIDYQFRDAAGNWSSVRNYGYAQRWGDADPVGPSIDVDKDGYKYVSFNGAYALPFVFVLDPNGNAVGGVQQVDGTQTGGKYEQPNVGSRKDMGGAYYTWGTSVIFVKSVGDISIGGGAAAVNVDFNGGRAELTVVDPATGNWYIRTIGGTQLATGLNWGWSGTTPLMGDYDGDGTNDLAVFHPATGNWYIRRLSGAVIGNPNGENWGWSSVIPVAGDFNGNGTTDLGVYDAATGNWYIREVSGAQILVGYNWGFAGCIPVPADYDGDGTTDLGVYHAATGNWYIRTVAGANILVGENWGFAGAVPAPADYDGDGTTEMCVFDAASGNWWIREVTGASSAPISWGWAGVQPVPGDYDGDGTVDFGVFDAATGNWYLEPNGATPINWGWSATTPVRGAAQ